VRRASVVALGDEGDGHPATVRSRSVFTSCAAYQTAKAGDRLHHSLSSRAYERSAHAH
jgi:hypothetical protein